MTAFNWDIMPAEFRTKLLEIAKLDARLEGCHWISMSEYEKKTLNEAMVEKSGGMASLKGFE